MAGKLTADRRRQLYWLSRLQLKGCLQNKFLPMAVFSILTFSFDRFSCTIALPTAPFGSKPMLFVYGISQGRETLEFLPPTPSMNHRRATVRDKLLWRSLKLLSLYFRRTSDPSFSRVKTVRTLAHFRGCRIELNHTGAFTPFP